MSREIIDEVNFLAYSVAMGILITFVYDFVLIGRRLVRHSQFFVSLEDFIFWASCAIVVFYMLYEENNGILRWFSVLGAACGMLIYKKTVGRYFVKFLSALIQKEIHIVSKVIRFILKPFAWGLGKVGILCRSLKKRAKKIWKYLKKKLTSFMKMLKMGLCKR